MLTDTHCHLGQFRDPAQVLRDSASANVRIVVATENPEEYRRLLTRLRGSETAIVGLGLHPASRAARDPAQLSRFFRFLPEARWVSEVGLDFQRNTDRIERRSQILVFESILSHAMIRSKVLSVHSRGAASEVTARLNDARVAAVMHWFSGTNAELEAAVEAGLYFSVNDPMLRSRRASALLARIPPDRLLLETDGPYARAADGSISSPAGLAATTKRLAELMGLPTDDLTVVLEQNHRKLLASAPTPG